MPEEGSSPEEPRLKGRSQLAKQKALAYTASSTSQALGALPVNDFPTDDGLLVFEGGSSLSMVIETFLSFKIG
jgi:hypothetical protein